MAILRGKLIFRKSFPDGIVPQSTDKGTSSFEDVLSERVLSITSIQDIDLAGGKVFSQDRFLILIGISHRGLGGDPLKQIEFEVEFGGFMVFIEPEGPDHFRQSGQKGTIKGDPCFFQFFKPWIYLLRKSLLS